MHSRLLLSRYTLLPLIVTSLAYCQEMRPRLGQAVTIAASSLRARPDAAAPELKQLPPNTSLRWIEGRQTAGFLHVLPEKGAPGWVAGDQVKIVSQPPAAAGGLAEAVQPACAADLAHCKAIGCAAAGSDHALMNRAKRRIPSANSKSTPIDFADLRKLQSAADDLVGSGSDLNAAERARLKNLALKNGTVDEGSVVRLTGFLATGPAKPHANTGESVNCRLKKAPNNDFHISIVEDQQGTEFDGFVVEMIPQKRPAGWTIGKLVKLQQLRRRVLVTGALLYDNAHVVNDDPNNELSGQPRRFTLWEVHPISSFLVCQDAQGNCDPDKPAQWTKLQGF